MLKGKTRMLIAVAMLSSISFVLMLLAFPLPVLPAYLKVDFSDIPALIAAITMGPVAGILVAFLKNVLDWLFAGSPTGVPVGHMANFVTSILFITPVYLIYRKVTSSKGIMAGLGSRYSLYGNWDECTELLCIFTNVCLFLKFPYGNRHCFV